MDIALTTIELKKGNERVFFHLSNPPWYNWFVKKSNREDIVLDIMLMIEALTNITKDTHESFNEIANVAPKSDIKNWLNEYMVVIKIINAAYNKLESKKYFNNERLKELFLDLYKTSYHYEGELRKKAFEGEINQNDPYSNYKYVPSGKLRPVPR